MPHKDESFTLNKPQPWPVGAGSVAAMTPKNPGPSTSKNPKLMRKIDGPGPNFGESPKA